MHDGRMIVENSNCHTLIYCVTTANNPKDSMMVGLRNFHKEKMWFRIATFGAVAL